MNMQDNAALTSSSRQSVPRRRWLSVCLFIAGLTFFGYLLGAAVMFFQLPSADFLSKAFLGARSWNEQRQLPPPIPVAQTPHARIGKIDKPEKTFDGFTLYTCVSMSVSGTQAFLINMRGDVVHHWAISYSDVWSQPPHVDGPVNDYLVNFFDCQLYPNGDLLVVFHGQEKWLNGYGLAKLDKDSKVIWKYAGNAHHAIEVGDDGAIYTIAHKVVRNMPKGLEFLPTPALVDELVFLSADGKVLREPLPILQAFRDSPYAPLLESAAGADKRDLPPGLNLPHFLNNAQNRGQDPLHPEPLHANSIRVLNPRLAAKFPQFRAGQLLVSLRNIDTIAVFDPQKNSVVWATRGCWRAQHDAQFLDNGRMMIFDNLGSLRGSRVLEYDVRTQAFPWSYPGADQPTFLTKERGMSQRLPNGNTLIVNSEPGEILEVTPQGETVWTCLVGRYVASARRYRREELPFLTGDIHARPQ
jgi:hypothetical protein